MATRTIRDVTDDEWQGLLLAEKEFWALKTIGVTNEEAQQFADRILKKLTLRYVIDIERRNAEVWASCARVRIEYYSAHHRGDVAWLAARLREVPALAAPRSAFGAAFLVVGSFGTSMLIRAATLSRFSHVALVLPPAEDVGDSVLAW
jgi:hypothetical protein